MLAPSGELLRAGLALKANHLKRATQSYLRDRANQTTGRMTSYAIAAGLFVVAGLLVVATCFVGLMALFRWVELNYGQFWAFGAVGAILLAVAAICAGLAVVQMRRPAKSVAPLASRLRVAITTPRIPRGTVKEAVKEVATTIPLVPLAPGEKRHGSRTSPLRSNRPVQLGLMLAAIGLLGMTAARRRRYSHRSGA
ncbi:phage holin family protein [Bradyrhizobium sp. CB1650]|uniref:phage holin family protein n=1 Tax=Bradyrhizobium sp. CB1650 TaxID=3039153 RepID=UPI002435644E|nr:phage holin family protein [Bradyrhizobium sp. CB1650]WGD53899.1 phage holin family protein [Bradyrhizobium sp. CB1650]